MLKNKNIHGDIQVGKKYSKKEKNAYFKLQAEKNVLYFINA